ncbi:hypothetical protein BpHYR1_025954 [Brachionus plicatilis]|uniref:Uncharacterized protein n=1 Tax=Brachionus plicatilis TaxID=10195 RepID=A0A3M7SMH7_BRAPC|nr:hypothetical protein BpHYR1_025954 [Brachionus plicatilis]
MTIWSSTFLRRKKTDEVPVIDLETLSGIRSDCELRLGLEVLCNHTSFYAINHSSSLAWKEFNELASAHLLGLKCLSKILNRQFILGKPRVRSNGNSLRLNPHAWELFTKLNH